MHPLGRHDIPVEVLREYTPSEAEIKDRSKSDKIAKALVLVQTLWFVIQCMARGIRHLPLTELEVVTLAYAMINFFIYIFWWDKPRDVACPVRVYKTSAACWEGYEPYNEKWYWKIVAYVLGMQDTITRITQEPSTPLFWSDLHDSFDNEELQAYLGPLVLSIAFGAIHCISWSAEFPTQLELVLWRASCIAMMATPLFPTVLCALGTRVGGDANWNEKRDYFMNKTWAFVLFPLILAVWLYILARIVTISIAFTSLWSLPLETFTVVEWTSFIPHL